MNFLDGRQSSYLALGLAAVAGILAYVVLHDRERVLRQGWNPVPAVVAARDIPEGTVLSEENLKPSTIPERFFTTSVIRPEEIDAKHVLGRKVSVPMAEGDPLLWTFVESGVNGSGRLADAVTKKTRAVSIRVSPESSVQNWIRPFDRVDVLATFRDPVGQDHVTMTLLENLVVLATGNMAGMQQPTAADKGYATVTLQVVPEAAEALVLGQELGSLYLTLRNPEDKDTQDSRQMVTSYKTLVGGERTKLLNKTQAKASYQNIDVIRGGRGSEIMRFPGRP